jgi:hypothetical protein
LKEHRGEVLISAYEKDAVEHVKIHEWRIMRSHSHLTARETETPAIQQAKAYGLLNSILKLIILLCYSYELPEGKGHMKMPEIYFIFGDKG